MARLIDADLLKRGISEKTRTSSEASRLIDIINSQPTAYDVDKVVEEMKEIEPYNWTDTDTEIAEHNMWEYCMDIVKRGGVEK